MSDRIKALADRIMEHLAPILAPLGYEAIAVDVIPHRADRRIRVTIDRLGNEPSTAQGIGAGIGPRIGVEDCATASRAIDEPLENLPEVAAFFSGPYELEVSSPGVERPLRRESDFNRFAGERAQLHVQRPLTSEETGNAAYVAANPKQKHFTGVLRGTINGKIRLELVDEQSILIPLLLVTKAHLFPQIDFRGLMKRHQNQGNTPQLKLPRKGEAR